MKTIIHLVIFSAVLFTFNACECKKNATTSPSSTTTTQPQPTTPSASANTITAPAQVDPSATTAKNMDETVRLVVSFYSKGEGIDSKSKEAFIKLLDSNTKKMAYIPTQWGREGEVDFCLELKELSAAEQEDFIKKTKELLNKTTLVHINEYAKCMHKN